MRNRANVNKSWVYLDLGNYSTLKSMIKQTTKKSQNFSNFIIYMTFFEYEPNISSFLNNQSKLSKDFLISITIKKGN